MRLWLLLCTLLWSLPLFCLLTPLSATLSPNIPHATTLPVLRIALPRSGTLPLNQNTADFDGFIFFDVLATWIPLICQINISKIDCGNPEIFTPENKLSVVQLTLEVDSNYGPYGKCNVCLNGTDPYNVNVPCARGEYICNCAPYSAGAATGEESPLPSLLTSDSTCGPAVGRLALNATAPAASCSPSAALDDCYWEHTRRKIGGLWYSTTAKGLCHPAPFRTKPCAWRVVALGPRRHLACVRSKVHAAVEAQDPSCFARCGPRNTTSSCWIRCFMSVLIGPSAEHSDVPGGLSLPEIRDIWSQPFLPVAQGGCPVLPVPPSSTVFDLPAMPL